MAIMNVTYMSHYLKRSVGLKVILPIEDTKFLDPSLVEKPAQFKTLYLLHGFSGCADDWVNGTRIFKLARDRNLAVVMPTGENSFYVDNEEKGIMYASYIGKEIVEFTRRMFPLSSKKEDTFIGGLSMGGFGSLLVGSKFCDTFGGILSLSAPIFLPNMSVESEFFNRLKLPLGYFEYLFGDLSKIIGSENDPLTMILKRYDEEKLPRMYIACGKEDALYENVITYVDILKKKHVDFCFEEGHGAHEWSFWDEYIERAIDWYLEVGK